MITAYVGIGSNTDKHLHIERAIQALLKIDPNLRMSTIYECPPVGFEGESFFNLMVEIKTFFTLSQFSQALRDIEFCLGRSVNAQKMQDRTIDLDIILFGDCVSEGALRIPREDIYNYAFVIQPLYELCPNLVIPKDGRTVKDVWFDTQGGEPLIAIQPWFDLKIKG
jgi:2-amino-4-hydroxy-6-hydroxymethyldihydropteridine diphosphokinase